VELTPVVDGPTLRSMQAALEQVHVSEAIEGYVVDLVAATRESRRLAVGASPRGSLALVKLSRAKAALDGRDFVIPEDVKAVAVPALAHRLTVRPELWVQRLRGEDVIAEVLESVPTPPAEDVAQPASA
jgi:MoxR-like ATPase